VASFLRSGFLVRSVLVDQAAELLGVSRRTVYYRIRDGKLKTFRTRGGSQRVWLDSIERLLRESVEARRTCGRQAQGVGFRLAGAAPGVGQGGTGRDAGV
jgi:excisionase family DNA binding protein